MSRENVEIVRSIYAGWERGDFKSVEWADPEIEFAIADGPAPSSSVGLAGMSEGWRNFLSAWQEWRTEADEYLEVDGERVLVLARFSGRGKVSGVELGKGWANGASLFHLRAGAVTRLTLYFDAKQALEAVGLSE